MPRIWKSIAASTLCISLATTALTVLAGAGPAAEEQDIRLYRQHIMTLANPYYEGRGSGTKGNALAAGYLEHYYRHYGLTPIFPLTEAAADGAEVITPRASYRQSFELSREADVVGQAMQFAPANAKTESLQEAVDFNVLSISADGEVTGEIAFVGYSIEEGPNGYTTYQEGDDLTGKIALILRFEPMDDAGKSLFAAGEGGGERRWSGEAALMPKLRRAVQRNAAGIIVVSPPGADDPRTDRLETAESSKSFGRALKVPVAMMSIEGADRVVKALDAKGRSLMDLRKAADKAGGIESLSGGKIIIKAEVKNNAKTTENLAGILEGKGDLADEYIVIGAHMDHVGFGHEGGSRTNEYGKLHPGADDNASGSSAVLVCMDRLTKQYADAPADKPMRSILFMHYSGEEMGLLGSKHFVKNSPLDAKQIYAMLNMDMVGRLRNGELELGGTGTAEGFDAIIDPLLTDSGLKIEKSPGGQGPSDHSSFYSANIPVLFFFTGFHDEYHAPTDTADLINCEGGATIAKLCCDIATTLAARTEPLVFQTTTPTFNRNRNRDSASAPAAPEPVPGRATPSMSAIKVRFGIAPGDYADTETGVVVGDVFEGTSASDAGILKDDRLVKWNGQEITDVASWMGFLAAHKPGDVVDVSIKRGEEEKVLKVKLKGRGDETK